MRVSATATASLLLVLGAPVLRSAHAQVTGEPDKTFLTRGDLAIGAVALGATALVSIFDDDIATASQRPTSTWQRQGLLRFATNVSKVNETTLTAAGILTYGIARLSGSRMVTDVALHTTESVVLASLASQVIRGPLGRARPYMTNDTNQYTFKFGRGFSNFDYRSFPSIHTSSGMAVATALTMEMKRRHWGPTPIVAPILFGAALLPGLARIPLNQHWASDIAAGAFMGVFSGYKVVSYSHDHPNNFFDRHLLKVSLIPTTHGTVVAYDPF
ncbi:MAG TPA: phosphatase PAP2 family protein [Gemmatimonadaceae bacterium]